MPAPLLSKMDFVQVGFSAPLAIATAAAIVIAVALLLVWKLRSRP